MSGAVMKYFTPILSIGIWIFCCMVCTISSAQDSIINDALINDSTESGVGESNPANSNLYTEIDRFGGPSSVSGQLAEDNQVDARQFRFAGFQSVVEPWFGFKQRVDQRIGLQFEADQTMLYQIASRGNGRNDASSGLFRFFGQWNLIGRRTGYPGYLVFKGENRHRIGSNVTPSQLGFDAGSAVLTATQFNDFSFSVTNLFWKQYLFDKRVAVVLGRIDVTDFVDVYALANPITGFLNLSFSANPTIAVPNQGFGTALGGMLTENIYVQGGFADANGSSTRAGFDTFFDQSEFFSYIEFGITPSQEKIYLENVHVTLWNSDARLQAGTPSGNGVAVTYQKFIDEKWLPFFRFGYSDGDIALLQTVFSTGIGLRRQNNDVAGLGLSWGKPSDNNARSQFTTECFYRFQLTRTLAITPDLQLIANPSFAPTSDILALFGVRARLAY